MSWYKKVDNIVGMHLNVISVEDIRYKDLIHIFGEPNGEVEKFHSNNTTYLVEWKLRFIDVPFKIRIDSGEWARKNLKKGKHQIPDVKEDFINEVKIVGKLEIMNWIIQPIIHYLSDKKVLNEDLHSIIKYTFTGFVK